MHAATRYLIVPFAGLALGAAFVAMAGRVDPVMATVLLGGLSVALVLLRFPYLAFMLTVAVVPMERLGRLTDDSSAYTISLMRLMGTLALGSMLLFAVAERWKIRFNLALFAYAAYFILAVVSVTHTSDLIGGVRASGAILGNILFFFLVVNMVRDWDTARRAVLIWLAATLVIALYTVYNWHFGAIIADAGIGDTDSRFSVVHDDASEHAALHTVRRALGPTSHSAVYAINLLLTVPFFLYLLRTSAARWQRTLAGGGLLVVLYNILLANTRAAILLTGLLLFLAAARRLLVVRAGTIAVGLIGVASLLPLVPSSTWERVLDPSNYRLENSGTLQIRLEYWQSALQIIRENWLFGVGIGNQIEVPKNINSVSSSAASATAHCEYLQTFLELGLPGWLLFMTFILLTLHYAFGAAAWYREKPGGENEYWFLVAVQIAMIGVLLYGLQVDVFHFPLKGWWLVAGIAAAVYGFTRDELQSAPAAGRG